MARKAPSKPADSTANIGFDWFRKDDDPASRDWQFDVPPKGNANFTRVQHFIHCTLRSLGGGHLAPQGMAGFGLA